MLALITLRLSRDQIEQIIAEYISAQFGGNAEHVEVWPVRGDYGAETFANVTVRNPQVFPEKYFSQPRETGSAKIPQPPI